MKPRSDSNPTAVSVVHLARRANGAGALEEFVRSYVEYPAGIAHRLVVLLKGYGSDPQAEHEARRLLAPHDAVIFVLADDQFDLDAYKAAANLHPSEYYCFLNSFSRILSRHWLATMMSCFDSGHVGIVAATGSWESLFSDEVQALKNLFRSHVERFRWHARDSSEMATQPAIGGYVKRSSRLGRVSRVGRLYWDGIHRVISTYRDYAPFPNYHVRTNAFVIPREILKRVSWPEMRTKQDAYRFESGRKSLTAQILGLGLDPVVVGKDGGAYMRGSWNQSGTFWQAQQDNLLIEDNQTRQYRLGSSELQRRLSLMAWGSAT